MESADDLVNVISNKEIIEYDIQPIIDSDALFRVEQDRYLLINKLRLKELYFKWRSEFLLKPNDLDKQSKLILLVNPNFLSAWSKRKEIFAKSTASFNEELKFNTLILSKNVKCEQAYVHRRWLIRTRYRSENIEKNLIDSEINLIVSCLAPKVKANYYCWTYFNWLAQFYDLECLLDYTVNKFVNVLFLNPSDYCVFHSRLNLLKLIFDCETLNREQFERLVINEIKLIDEILLRFAVYSTVWNYSRYFFLLLQKPIRKFDPCLDVDSLSKELSSDFVKQVKNVFFRLNDSEINLDKINIDNHVFDYLIKREISIADFILKLYRTKEEEFSKIQQHHSNYLKFIERFLFIKN